MSNSTNTTDNNIQEIKGDLTVTNHLIQLTLMTRSTALIVWTMGLMAIGLRFLSRKITRSGIWWDDWLALPVLVFSTAQCFVTSIWFTKSNLRSLRLDRSYDLYEIGETPFPADAYEGDDHDYALYQKAIFTLEFCWILAAALVKIATVAFYWRLFGQALWKRRTMTVLAALTVVWGLSTVFATIFQCRTPVSNIWNNTPDISCDATALAFGNAIPHIMIDSMLLLLPVPWIWRSPSFHGRQKSLILVIFTIGIFTTVTSFVRLVYLTKIAFLLATRDNFIHSILWTNIEINTAIVCFCVPCLGPAVFLFSSKAFLIFAYVVSCFVRALNSFKGGLEHSKKGPELLLDLLPTSRQPATHNTDVSPEAPTTTECAQSELSAEMRPPAYPSAGGYFPIELPIDHPVSEMSGHSADHPGVKVYH